MLSAGSPCNGVSTRGTGQGAPQGQRDSRSLLSIVTLTGFLASRRQLWSESAADLLLLPADGLLFIPAVPGAIVIAVLLGPGLGTAMLAVVIVLLTRCAGLENAVDGGA